MSKVSKKKTVCNLIILDASGSMESKKEDVKGGLKQLFNDIKENTKLNQRVIIAQFDNTFKVLCDVDASELDYSIIEKYKPSGSTALYDAMGIGFNMVPNSVDGVFVSIITDGEENASKIFNKEVIKSMIKSKNELNWGITFSGTSEEAIYNAKDIGILNTLQTTNDSKGLNKMSASRSQAYDTFTSSVERGLSSAEYNTTTLFTE